MYIAEGWLVGFFLCLSRKHKVKEVCFEIFLLKNISKYITKPWLYHL